jgi:hypothetical protein
MKTPRIFKELMPINITPPPALTKVTNYNVLTHFLPPASSGRHFSLPPLSLFSRFRLFVLALVAALALPLAAQAANININAPGDWYTPITLNNSDVLSISAAAGSPGVATVIQIAANANVDINGPGTPITNLSIADNAGDTLPHTTRISNLQITSGVGPGYTQVQGVFALIGDNAIRGAASAYGINALGGFSITSASGGTLAVTGDGANGIELTSSLSITGNADVTVYSTAWALSGGNTIDVAADAKLDASTGISGITAAASLTINCDGTITTKSIGANNVAITGSGTLTATATGPNAAISVLSLTVDGTTVNATGGPLAGYGLFINGATNVALTNGATLNLTGGAGSNAFSGPGFTVDAGSTVTLTNNAAAAEAHPFTMAAGAPASSVWQLSGAAALVAPSIATSSPATISVPSSSTGTIRLGAPPPPTATAVPALSEWALLILAAMLGWTALVWPRKYKG